MTDSSRQLESTLLPDLLFGLTVAALFSGINWKLGGIKIQLADLLSLLSIFVVMLRGFDSPRVAAPFALVLGSYVLMVCISGLSVSLLIGVKEFTQAVLAVGFLVAIFGYYRSHASDRFLLIATALIVAVLVYNIGWHVTHGFYVGWKRLNEPKAIFVVLPLILVVLFDRFGQNRKALFAGLSVIATLVILLSGERKAYLIVIFSFFVWTGVSSLRYIAVAMLLSPLLLPFAAFDETGYMHQQIESFSNAFTDRAQTASTNELFDVGRAASLSDAQREFTHRIARSMWEKQPVFGIGTGAYALAMERYNSVPDAFRAGIHGEFYRALFENGIIGLAFYIGYWVAAALTVLFVRAGYGVNAKRLHLLCAITFFVYCSAEASKGLTVLSLCALPFIFSVGYRPAREDVGRGSHGVHASMTRGFRAETV